MSTELDTRDDHLTGLSTIEGVDLDAEVMCEHSQHGVLHRANQPAWARVRAVRICCSGYTRTYLLCAEGWLRMGANGVYCRECKHTHARDDMLTVLHVL